MSFDTMLRAVTIACCAGCTLFWLYTFYYIAQVPEGDGTGFQWLAEVPLTAIFLFITCPAILLSQFPRAMPIAAGLAITSVILFAILWSQLLAEFAG